MISRIPDIASSQVTPADTGPRTRNAGLLTAGTIQYEGYVRDGQQTLVLKQAPVSGPGVRS
jgi:hypothetical protein